MAHRLATREGKRLYALRKQIPEPVFGHYQIGDGVQTILLARTAQGQMQMEFGNAGLEREADVYPRSIALHNSTNSEPDTL